MLAFLLIFACADLPAPEVVAPPAEAPVADAQPPDDAPPRPPGPPVEPEIVPRWIGETVTGGASPIRLTLTPWDDGRMLAEIYWHDYEKASAEQAIQPEPGCDPPEFADVKKRVDGACSHVIAQLRDVHPTYDYVSTTKLRCVFGDVTSPGFCKLNYTGWFEVGMNADDSGDPAELAKALLLELAAGAVEPPPVPVAWEGKIQWTHGLNHTFHGLEPHCVGEPLDLQNLPAEIEYFHGCFFDADGVLRYRTGNPVGGTPYVADHLIYDAEGRPLARINYAQDKGLSYVDMVYRHRGEPAFLGRGGPNGLVYRIEPVD